jgi:PAS domain S-box-containing protein
MQSVEGTAMKHFIRSFTEKIDSLMSALSSRSGTSLEEEQKIRFFTLVTFLAIPIFIGFLILHLSQGTAAHPVILLLAGAGQVLSLLAVGRLQNPKVAFRICASVLGVYFLFLIAVGGTHGTTMLWMLIMPAYFFFVLGKGEGLVWTAAGFLASLFVISDPIGLFSTYHYERTVAVRFLLTYGLIAAIAYFGESTRERYAEQLLQVQTQRFQNLCAHAPFGMVIIDKDGEFRYANPQFKEIFGYDLSDVPNGREWSQKAYPDRAYRHKTIAAWKEDLEGLAPGEKRSRVFEVTCKDRNRKIIQFRQVKLVAGENLMAC